MKITIANICFQSQIEDRPMEQNPKGTACLTINTIWTDW
jgi:hypothetical protein